jgi:hypothetical protein
VSGRAWSADPSSRFLFRSVLGDGLTEKLRLVRDRTPSTVDLERDAAPGCIGRSSSEGVEQARIEVGHGRDRVIEDRGAIGDETVSFAKRAINAAKHTMVVAAQDLAERGR